MIDEDDIPEYFYRIEYQSDSDAGTDEWSKGNSYLSLHEAESALVGHIQSYPYLPARVKCIGLERKYTILGNFDPFGDISFTIKDVEERYRKGGK